ncbi:MAG: LysR substrate-binding domain-containing protein [Burkholderiales bacterium]|jgi:DNA-binding transcriptional LysR family regulator
MKLGAPAALSGAALTLEQLRLFSQVAELGSLRAAARELNVSPSLATRKIASLELALKMRLFERTTRNVKLTEAGNIALRWARHTLENYEEVTDDLASLRERPSGTVRLAVNHYAGGTYLPPLLQNFCAIYPEIQLSIATTDSIAELLDSSYDVAIHSGRVPDSRVVGVRLREYRRVLCAAPAYLQRRAPPAKLEDLGTHDCLVHSTNEPLNWFFRKGKRLIAQPVKPRIEADSHVLLLSLVRLGLGIARLGYNLVKSELAAGKLVELLPSYKCVYSSGELPGIWIIYPNRRVLYRTRVLIDFLTEQLARPPA